MNRKNKLAALIMVAIGLGIFVFEMRSQPLEAFAKALSKINLWWLLAAVFVMLASWVVETFVVQVFIAHENEHLPFKAALRVPLVEQLFNNITPFASGGQPAQLLALMQAGVEAGRASSVLLMKFVVYQFIVLINFVLVIVLGFKEIASEFGALALLIVFGFVIHVVVIIGLLLVMYRYRFTKRLIGWVVKVYGFFASKKKVEAFDQRMQSKVDSFYAESLVLKREKGKVFKAAALTFVQLLLYYSVPYFVLRSFGVSDLSLISVMVLHVMIVMIVSLFPIPGGTGGAEYSFKTLFARYIPDPVLLLLTMLIWRILTYYLGIFMGIGALAITPNRFRQGEQNRENQ